MYVSTCSLCLPPTVTVASPYCHCHLPLLSLSPPPTSTAPSLLQAILLLCKASCPALTLSDVFTEESLVQYLTVCCRSWGGGTGEGQSPSVWLTAMESVVLEIFQ